MSSFNEVMKKIVSLPENEKLSMISNSYTRLMPIFSRLDPNTRGLSLMLTLVGSSAGADGKLTAKEANVVQAVSKASGLDVNSDTVKQIVKTTSNQEAYALIQKMSASLQGEDKAALVSLAAGICALDNRMSKEELNYISSLLQ